jgi:hypothetical protein
VTAAAPVAGRHGASVGGHGAIGVLRTSLGRRLLVTNSLIAFGAVSAVVEFLAALFRWFPPHPAITFAASLAVCAGWGFMRARPGLSLQYRMRTLDVTLLIVIGDLFAQDTHIAVGFSDTFDTSLADDRVIHHASVQGQLLRRVFDGNQKRLDDELARSLRSVSPVRTESRADKPHGKLARYPLGTVAVLGDRERLVFGVAYGIMGNDLVVRAPVEDLWRCFSQLWEAVYRNGQRAPLSIPLMGSSLARVDDSLDRDSLLRLIVLSFVAYSRARMVCHELRIVIRPEDAAKLDLAGLRAFLRAF